ncbi:hypothetical protein LZ32DRAFT_319858 [Colletotrichum eremochloae]|nr:hypothetical protein LZ32DRAFT_319858 [Colletotrichum eremochloae]
MFLESYRPPLHLWTTPSVPWLVQLPLQKGSVSGPGGHTIHSALGVLCACEISSVSSSAFACCNVPPSASVGQIPPGRAARTSQPSSSFSVVLLRCIYCVYIIVSICTVPCMNVSAAYLSNVKVGVHLLLLHSLFLHMKNRYVCPGGWDDLRVKTERTRLCSHPTGSNKGDSRQVRVAQHRQTDRQTQTHWLQAPKACLHI